mmetsp:Transcript_276/g.728  ORF Transcript_276/g.728 Transcript_276/m.728 type:complete len:100 (-) Transcript_276:3249-3548(-)
MSPPGANAPRSYRGTWIRSQKKKTAVDASNFNGTRPDEQIGRRANKEEELYPAGMGMNDDVRAHAPAHQHKDLKAHNLHRESSTKLRETEGQKQNGLVL